MSTTCVYTPRAVTSSSVITWSCPICDNKVYASKGGYHRHLREKHKIGWNGDKLTDAKIKELREAEKNSDDASEGDAD